MGLLIKLKNGDTTLKSLKYGNDRPGGGDSGQPYIKDPIDKPTTPLDEDSILRGGLKAPLTAAEDVARLTKYFFDFRNPNGLLFVGKQNLLSRISPKTETSFGLGYGGASQNTNLATGENTQSQGNGFFNAGIYTPLSTLAQAGVGFTGAHLNKQGIDPTGLIPLLSVNKYQDVAYRNNLEENNEYTGQIPLSLYRRSRKASDKAGRKLVSRNNQQAKTNQTLSSNPERRDLFTTRASINTFQTVGNLLTPFRNAASTANLRLNGETNITTGGELGVKGALFLEEQRTAFFRKWDKYIDNLSQSKLDKKEQSLQKAFDQQDTLYNQVLEEEAKVRYDNRLLQLWTNLGYNPVSPSTSNSPFLYSYGGGPNSVLGIGKTNIKFATKNDGVTPSRTDEGNFYNSKKYKRDITYSTVNIFGRADDPNASVSLQYLGLGLSSPDQIFGNTNYLIDNNETVDPRLGLKTNPSINLSTSENLIRIYDVVTTNYSTWNEFNFNNQISNQGKTSKYKEYSDFRTQILPTEYNKTFLGKGYDLANNIENLYGLGNPGAMGDVSDYTKGKGDSPYPNGTSTYKALDKVTYSSIYKSSNGAETSGDYEDIIPFYIGTIDNSSLNAELVYTHFRAFINDFGDSYKAKWNTQNYMGRAESFYKYQSFDRDLTLSFVIVAQSRQEQKIMYDKLNFLASTLAPEYLNNGYMAGNISYLTVGDYIYDQPGIIQSLNFKISKDSPWDTARNPDGTLDNTGEVYRLPFMIDVSMTFQPIHTFRPEKQTFDKIGAKDNKINFISQNQTFS